MPFTSVIGGSSAARLISAMVDGGDQPQLQTFPAQEDQSEIEQSKLDADAIRLCVRGYPVCKPRIDSHRRRSPPTPAGGKCESLKINLVS
jgi:hypothetical protein